VSKLAVAEVAFNAVAFGKDKVALLMVVVPVAAPKFNAVAAPPTFRVVAVVLNRFPVVWLVATVPPLALIVPVAVIVLAPAIAPVEEIVMVGVFKKLLKPVAEAKLTPLMTLVLLLVAAGKLIPLMTSVLLVLVALLKAMLTPLTVVEVTPVLELVTDND